MCFMSEGSPQSACPAEWGAVSWGGDRTLITVNPGFFFFYEKTAAAAIKQLTLKMSIVALG